MSQNLTHFITLFTAPTATTQQQPIRNMEKSNFPSLSKQELQVFRKEIERDNSSAVFEMINANPRYLVSSGDTPTILKEGPRYNALHFAAINNRETMAKIILQTVENPRFIEVLHGIPNHPNGAEMTQFILDSYLNTPDKSRGETPLHFAAKHGALDVVKVLISYPACKMTLNTDGLLPKEIICTRMPGMSDGPAKDELKREIEKALEEKYFVPVLRSSDRSLQPVIGEPFSASNIPKLTNDIKSPNMEIKAYAGPMSSEQAQTFRKRWKTPPRLTPTTVPQNLNLSFSPNSSPRSSKQNNSLTTILASTPKANKNKPKKLFGDDTEMDELNGNHNDLTSKIMSEQEKEEFDEIFDDLLESKIQLEKEKGSCNFDGYRNPKQFNLEETPIRVKNDNNSNHLNLNLNGSLNLLKSCNSINDSSMLCNGRSETSYTGVTYLDESGSMYNSDNVFDSPSFKERNIRLTDNEKGKKITIKL